MANVTNVYSALEKEGQIAQEKKSPAPILFVNRMLEHTDDYQSVTILTGIIEWLGQVSTPLLSSNTYSTTTSTTQTPVVLLLYAHQTLAIFPLYWYCYYSLIKLSCTHCVKQSKCIATVSVFKRKSTKSIPRIIAFSANCLL